MATTLARRILDGEVRAAARLMRWVDDRDPRARAELDALFAHTGQAYLVGITGNPGSGKSTLVNAFIHACRDRDLTVGVVAIDPTSPFSGGAILGDRIRMQDHATDRGVFIRSVATRGNLGGLSRSTPAIVQILDAMGFDLIVIETVGVGQDEVDVVSLADTSVVVTVPNLGDDIQATKAGIMEIADVFVINKSDLPGADRLRRELKTMMSLKTDHGPDAWHPPVVHTTATERDGLAELLDAVDAHRAWLEGRSAVDGATDARDRRRLSHLVRLIASGELDRLLDAAMAGDAWEADLTALLARQASPHEVVDRLIARLRDTGSPA